MTSRQGRLTWIGHSSFLGTLGGHHFLIDPVFARHAGVLYPRHCDPGLHPADIPDLSAILVTHNHYDHLDYRSLKAFPAKIPVVVPSGLGSSVRRHGHNAIELAWWETTSIDGLHITLVPACHWSRRGILDTNRTHWGGFIVESDVHRIYHAGDTAWSTSFLEIGRRFPGLAAAILPIGGYEPAWFMERFHLNPELAGRAFLDLGARRMVPMHWGTFQLTDEPLEEPMIRLRTWWEANPPDAGRILDELAVGETLDLDEGRLHDGPQEL